MSERSEPERAEVAALDPLEMLLDAARYAEGSSSKYSNHAWAKAARAAVAKARLVAPAAADSNASAEARLMEARSAFQRLAADCHRSKWAFDMSEESPPNAYEARRLVRKAFDEVQRIGNIAMHERDALSPDPHASDCEKQGETTKSIPVQDAEPANVAGRTGGAHPPTGANPSDRPADVMVEVSKLAQRYIDCTTDDMPPEIKMPTVNELGDALCALLRTVGRR